MTRERGARPLLAGGPARGSVVTRAAASYNATMHGNAGNPGSAHALTDAPDPLAAGAGGVDRAVGAVAAPPVWRHAIPVLLALLVFVSFMPALSAGLVHWDDDDLLLHQTRHRVLDAETLVWMFSTSYAGHFQPLTWLSYSLDWALWQREDFGYHLTNVLLHVLSAGLFYLISLRLLRLACRPGGINGCSTPADLRPRPGSDGATHSVEDVAAPATEPYGAVEAESRRMVEPGAGGRRRQAALVLGAGLAAAYFAVHPLRVESVAWLAERRDVLGGALFFASVLFYLRYAGGRCGPVPGQPGSVRQDYLASIFLCGLSLLAKASAVTLPLILLILDFFPLRRFRNRRPGAGARSAVWADKIPFVVICGAAGIRALVAQWEQGAAYTLEEYGLGPRLAQAVHGLAFYLVKTAWPTDLGPLYPIPPLGELFGPRLWLSAVVVLVLVVAAIGSVRRMPAITAAIAVYVVQVLPVLGFFQSGPQLVADRYSYLSCSGFAVLVGGGFFLLLTSRVVRYRPSLRSLLHLAAVATIVSLSHATFRQSDVWSSPLSLWTRGVRIAPDSSVARLNYGDALAGTQQYVAAVEEYRKSLALNPQEPMTARHLARVLGILGAYEPAIQAYTHAIELEPAYGPAYADQASLLLRAGRPHEAMALLRARFSVSPRDRAVMRVLADMLGAHHDPNVRNGREAAAIGAALVESSGHGDPVDLMVWATALAEAGRFAESVLVGIRAVRIADAYGNDGLMEAIQHRLARFCLGKPFHYRNPYAAGE